MNFEILPYTRNGIYDFQLIFKFWLIGNLMNVEKILSMITVTDIIYGFSQFLLQLEDKCAQNILGKIP